MLDIVPAHQDHTVEAACRNSAFHYSRELVQIKTSAACSAPLFGFSARHSSQME